MPQRPRSAQGLFPTGLGTFTREAQEACDIIFNTLLDSDSDSEEDERGLRPASRGDIVAFPVQTLTADDPRLREKASCSICIEDFKAGDEVRTIPCLHLFHKSCIDQWLQRQGTCPICKHRIGTAEGSSHLPQELQRQRAATAQRGQRGSQTRVMNARAQRQQRRPSAGTRRSSNHVQARRQTNPRRRQNRVITQARR